MSTIRRFINSFIHFNRYTYDSYSIFHNNYEQISNTLISVKVLMVSRQGGKMEKNSPKKPPKGEIPYFPHV